MPTQSTTYNTRLTDEALEKRFRDTFRSQSGAELVDDLYASGVIVPVVDFTAAAEGSSLRQDLQRAWDITTGHLRATNTNQTIITTPGFWLLTANIAVTGASGGLTGAIKLSDGLSSKTIWQVSEIGNIGTTAIASGDIVVFVRTDDSVIVDVDVDVILDVSYRNIADVYGNLTDPSGYQSS